MVRPSKPPKRCPKGKKYSSNHYLFNFCFSFDDALKTNSLQQLLHQQSPGDGKRQDDHEDPPPLQNCPGSTSQDIIKLSSMARLLDAVLEVHQAGCCQRNSTAILVFWKGWWCIYSYCRIHYIYIYTHTHGTPHPKDLPLLVLYWFFAWFYSKFAHSSDALIFEEGLPCIWIYNDI